MPLPGARHWGTSVAASLRLRKVESPSYNPVPGEDSFASDYSGGEDEGGTYLPLPSVGQ